MKIKEYIINKIDVSRIDKSETNSIKPILSELYGNMYTFATNKEAIISVLFSENEILIYVNNGQLIATSTDLVSVSLTEYAIELSKNNKDTMDKIKSEMLEYLLLAYQIHSIFSLNIKRNIIKSKLYSKIKIPKYSIECKLYEYDFDDDYFLINKGMDNFEIIPLRAKEKHAYQIPNGMYPLSNPNYYFFDSENTYPLDDNNKLSEIISPLPLRLGDCHNNTLLMLEAIKKAGYDKEHKVERMSGWVIISSNSPQYHSWLVIDGKHIIDSNNDLRVAYLEKEAQKVRSGIKANPVTREDSIKSYKAGLKVPYHERCIYGKVQKSFLYIGCVNYENNSRKIMEALLSHYPNHPALKNTNIKTGNNELQEMARKQGL